MSRSRAHGDIPRRLRDRILLGRERRDVLESHGWYRSLAGTWVHPHGMDFMSAREIRRCSPHELAYKCVHGSCAPYPG